MLTAKAAEEDGIAGLELGADDYLTKPFSPRELALRALAILRRGRDSAPSTGQLVFGELLRSLRLHSFTQAKKRAGWLTAASHPAGRSRVSSCPGSPPAD